MFSNDKNIEKLALIIESIKDYIGLQKEFLQLSAIEKTVRLLTFVLLAIILSFFILLFIIFLSFAAAYALTGVMPAAMAFLTVAGFYLLLFMLVYAKRKAWIQKPLIKLFAEILTN